MPVILGIDPGVTGALIWLDTVPPVSTGELLLVMDHTAWCNHHEPAKELHTILNSLLKPDLVIMEQQHARPNHRVDPSTGEKKTAQGIASTWNYAEHYGILRGVLAAFPATVVLANPAVWKANMGVTFEKETSLALARKKWPMSLEMFKFRKNHGRAEAALLAEYGRRFLPPLTLEKKRRVL